MKYLKKFENEEKNIKTNVYPPSNDKFKKKVLKLVYGSNDNLKSIIRYLKNIDNFNNFNDFKSIITTMIDVAAYEIYYFENIILLIINTYWNAEQGHINFTQKQIKDFLIYLFTTHIPLELKASFLSKLYWVLKKNKTSDTILPYPFPINIKELEKIVTDCGGWDILHKNAKPLKDREEVPNRWDD